MEALECLHVGKRLVLRDGVGVLARLDQLAFCEVLVCEVTEAIQGHLCVFLHRLLEAE